MMSLVADLSLKVCSFSLLEAKPRLSLTTDVYLRQLVVSFVRQLPCPGMSRRGENMKLWFRPFLIGSVVIVALLMASIASASTPGSDVRLSNDFPGGGYVSAYTIATGNPYTDATLDECSIARGRQNEPSVAVDPRNTNVLIGSSNDYCGVYAGSTPGNFVAAGPIWLGYYRSENSGQSFQSSLVPGYPGDSSPYAGRAHVRTSSAGDPVIAWDNH